MKPTYISELLTGSGYLVIEVDETASPYYYAYMRPDGSYVIVQDTITGSALASRYYKGFGLPGFAAIWAGKGGLTYGYPPTIFI